MSKHLPKPTPPRGRPKLRRVSLVERPRPNRYHTFLKRLQAGGRSNMYGAIPYLMHAFALDRDAAFRIVCEWVDAHQTAAAVEPAGRVSPTR